jgi:hypothetical protein
MGFTQQTYDFGDAPDKPYPTLNRNNGARHIINRSIYLGKSIDHDKDGQPNTNATGDDNDGNDDEDGVSLPSSLIAGKTANITVTASVSGKLNAWVDFNDDGDWADTGEKIFTDKTLSSGANSLSFNVPRGSKAGTTYARFRFSTSGKLNYKGTASDGEVEDYKIEIKEDDKYDFGDAPDQPYPTVLKNNGARHKINPDVFMGGKIDNETDGQPNSDATGDDNHDKADEDGVSFTSSIVAGTSVSLVVTASIRGKLNAWIDFNKDGDWADTDEQIFMDKSLNSGNNSLSFIVPSKAYIGETYARFRFSINGKLSYTGSAADGEVEDYKIKIRKPDEPEDYDFGDAPDPNYETLKASGGAYHTVNDTIYLGREIDAETDGQPNSDATGDDINNINDEDGVKIPTLNPGQKADIKVTVAGRGFLNGWIDFNADGDWADANEQIITALNLSTGTYTITINVPDDAVTRKTFSRFRYSTQKYLSYRGYASDGEVEDYIVTIEESQEPEHSIETDVFELIFSNFELVIPNEVNSTLSLKGEATQKVYFEGSTEGIADDNDSNGLEEVRTELVDLKLTGVHPTLGSIQVRLNPGIPSLGQIEENTNNTSGLLDVPPFTPGGTANSFFDVFFEIEVGGNPYYNTQPKRIGGVIHHKPPARGDILEDCQTIELLDINGRFSGIVIRCVDLQTYPPPVEIDIFEQVWSEFELVLPTGPGVNLSLNGQAEQHVFFEGATEGTADDDDGDNLEEVETELVALNLSGYNEDLGTIQVRLNSSIPSLGEIEEKINNTTDLLDVAPFTSGGTANSFFDVFFEIEVGGNTYYNIQPKRIGGVIHHKPPARGDILEDCQTIELLDINGRFSGIYIRCINFQTNPPPVEIDLFEQVWSEFELVSPTGSSTNLLLKGQAEQHVFFEGSTEGMASDNDGDGLEEVETELVDLNLTGYNANLGTVQVNINSSIPSLGEIEENINNTANLLDVGPFTSGGTANSFFDVFFEIEVGGQKYYNSEPKRLSGVINHKPPAPGDILEDCRTIQLLDATGQPTGYYIRCIRLQTNSPPVETDVFELVWSEFQLTLPDGSNFNLSLKGEATQKVYFEGSSEGTANDGDSDGLEEVHTELVDLNLTSSHPALGTVKIGLNPNIPSLGEIEENINNTSGLLDVPPFAAGGTANSFFDVFFEIEVSGNKYYNIQPKHMGGTIHHKPPSPGDILEDCQQIDLYDANGNLTGLSIICTRIRFKVSIETDVFNQVRSEFELVAPNGAKTQLSLSGQAVQKVYFEGAGEGTANDGDGNGKEEVQTEIVSMSLSGYDPQLGIVQVGLNPNKPSLGQLEEKINNLPGIMEVAPFIPIGSDDGTFIVDSFFDVFFEITIDGSNFLTMQPKRIRGTIRHKPPKPGDDLEDCERIEIYDENGNQTGFAILCVNLRLNAREIDYGDALDDTTTNYPTLRVNNGASHIINDRIFLGNTIDAESDGQSSTDAQGDDLNKTDDEDGIVIPALEAGKSANIDIVAQGEGYFNGWIDFNNDNDWDEPNEHIFNDYYLTTGTITKSISVPASAVSGLTFARFRYSTDTSLTYLGAASDGEVEDYTVRIIESEDDGRPRKWSQPPYRNTDSPHPESYWGWDELSVYAKQIVSDDWLCTDKRPITDVHWWGSYQQWYEDKPPSTSPHAFHIGIWKDVPAGVDQDWSHPGEMIWQWIVEKKDLNERIVGSDFHPDYMDKPDLCFRYDFIIPKDRWFYQEGDSTIYWISISALYQEMPNLNRWGWKTRPHYFNDDAVRMSSPETPSIGSVFKSGQPVLDKSGVSWDMAFELTTTNKLDFGDAPDSRTSPGYPTLSTNSGAFHVIRGPWLGDDNDAPDAEAEGQPDVNALGDDNDTNDDEDGVTIPVLTQGKTANITIKVNGGGGYVNGWIDYNKDRTWDASEQIINSSFTPGTYTISVTVPDSSIIGQTFARFRINSKGALGPKGSASDGEVEDYEVKIEEGEETTGNPKKWSQPPYRNLESPHPKSFWGWDELSVYSKQIVADDWLCTDTRPVTDIHWWGSYQQWNEDKAPENSPSAFHIGIWKDVPAGVDKEWSHPGEMIWEWIAGRSELNERVVGSDFHPDYMEKPDSCFRYDFIIPEEKWFYQEGDSSIYWISISALYQDMPSLHRWGWKTRPHYFNDDAVRISSPETPNIGAIFSSGEPIWDMNNVSWDMAFELTTISIAGTHDLGDAPDNSNSYNTTMTAYPGVTGRFPTVFSNGSPPYGPIHLEPRQVAFLGEKVTLENEADIGPDEDQTNNLEPQNDKSDLDRADDGVKTPLYLPHCEPTQFEYIVTVMNPFDQGLYVNVWFDWNRSGDWNDNLTCSGTTIPEWAVQNQLITVNNAGVYTFTTPTFYSWHPDANKDTSQTWMRITLSDKLWTPQNADDPIGGTGPAEGYRYGETEDYYFIPFTEEIKLEYGDAPEGALAYPTLGVDGKFPTCKRTGPAGYIEHGNKGWTFFGYSVDYESEGNGGYCPSFNPDLYNQDETSGDGDCGIDVKAYTIQGPVGSETVVPIIPDYAGALGNACELAEWGTNINLWWDTGNPEGAYINILFDWNQDGEWGGFVSCPDSPMKALPEHVMVNYFVPNGNGYLSVLSPPAFRIGPNTGYIWARFTITERPIDTPWNGTGVFEDGETEDYLVLIGDTGKLFDFGDAPDSLIWPGFKYPTRMIDNGARHILNRDVFLGSKIDAEPDGKPESQAEGDDKDGNDDEDGIKFISPLIPGKTAVIKATASVPGVLSSWIDFDKDGDWSGNNEQIFNNKTISSGSNQLTFPVPSTAVSDTTYARFRFCRDSIKTYSGEAPDGEVEDYQVVIIHESIFDFGDAPDKPYPTLIASGGAVHQIDTSLYLGDKIDPESDGQPDIKALGDDILDGNDDEDGIYFSLPIKAGQPAQLKAIASNKGFLNGWLDFNGNGDWGDADDYIIKNVVLVGGSNLLNFNVPLNTTKDSTYARFRFSSVRGLKYAGRAPDGEVEDYKLLILRDDMRWDFGDAPDTSYQTLLISNGARHLIDTTLFMGHLIDAEADGQPFKGEGDDILDGSDDEDGVIFLTKLNPGNNATIKVIVSRDGYLNAWFDFDLDQSWTSASEKVFTDRTVSAGSNTLSFAVPATAKLGRTYARFRYTTYRGIDSFGPAKNGEVEDYPAIIEKIESRMDYGDAPDRPYPTLLKHNGARHTIDTTLYLGKIVDADNDGQPDSKAMGDDLFDGSDDEDGVLFGGPLVPGNTTTVTVEASAKGILNVWIDFNGNGKWSDPDDHIVIDLPITGGSNTISITVPGNTTADTAYSRFRFSSIRGLNFYGPAPDGEVEDFIITVEEPDPDKIFDFGDAPDKPYPTLLINNGARHGIIRHLYLGTKLDAESDGQPDPKALGDDLLDGNDDEDGVQFTSALIAGFMGQVTITASDTGILNAWIDFNQNGSWADAGDQIFTDKMIYSGANTLSFSIPASSRPDSTYARFRFSSEKGITYTGFIRDGEVEDYLVRLTEPEKPLDFGDAPDEPYPTLLANHGAAHIIDSLLYLGNRIDAESDGQPNWWAEGDDFLDGSDDEDGVIFTSDLKPGQTADVTVIASRDGYLNAWIDFSRNGSWGDPGDQIFINKPLSAGGNPLNFHVPASARPDTTYSRFRFSSEKGLSYKGISRDGEVEDYIIAIEPPSDSTGRVLNLPQGWSLFSINVDPTNDMLSKRVMDIPGLIHPFSKFTYEYSELFAGLILMKNAAGQTFIPYFDINDIGEFNFLEGYQILINEDEVVNITGTPIDPTNSVIWGGLDSLGGHQGTGIFNPGGWSILGYLPNIPILIDQALADLYEQILCVINSAGQKYIPSMGINEIGYMQPGEGYLISLSDSGSLSFPAGPILKEQEDSLHFTYTEFTGNNEIIVVPQLIYPTDTTDNPLETGDEIGVFTSAGLCCGAGIWEDMNLAITVWGDNFLTDSLDGFLPGDTLYFRIWDKSNDYEMTAIAGYESPEDLIYEHNGYIVLTSLEGDQEISKLEDNILPLSYHLYQNFPNPFNPQTEIKFTLPQSGYVRLTIYNILGQYVHTLIHKHIPAGYHKVNWRTKDANGQSVASGIYIYRLEVSDINDKDQIYSSTRKMLLLR